MRALHATLRAQGVGSGTLVGLCVNRTPDMIVGMLAIMAAGGAYVPLDPAYPRERLGFILEDTAAPVIVAHADVLDVLPPHGARLALVGDDHDPPSPNAGSPPDVAASESDLAYLIYTSGSTGRPKGVAIEHRNAVALVRWAHRVFTPEQLAGVLAATSMCFDLSVFEIFVPLAVGGAVILAENALHLPMLPARDLSLIHI